MVESPPLVGYRRQPTARTHAARCRCTCSFLRTGRRSLRCALPQCPAAGVHV